MLRRSIFVLLVAVTACSPALYKETIIIRGLDTATESRLREGLEKIAVRLSALPQYPSIPGLPDTLCASFAGGIPKGAAGTFCWSEKGSVAIIAISEPSIDRQKQFSSATQVVYDAVNNVVASYSSRYDVIRLTNDQQVEDFFAAESAGFSRTKDKHNRGQTAIN